MAVAFLILAHSNSAQLRRLIERLEGPGANLHLHIDRKSDWQSLAAAATKNVDVVPREQSVPVYWGGFSMVRAIYALLERAYANEENRHFCLLSGACYPAASRDRVLERLSRPGQLIEVERQLSVTGSAEFDRYIRYVRLQDNPITNSRTGSFLRRPVHLVLRAIRRRPPPDFDFFHGSAWWSLDRRGAKAVIEFPRERPDVMRFYRFSSLPDESMFSSILRNGSSREEIAFDWLARPKPADWPRNVHATHYVDWTVGSNGSPKTLVLDDLDAIIASGAALARKTDPVASASLLDALDRQA